MLKLRTIVLLPVLFSALLLGGFTSALHKKPKFLEPEKAFRIEAKQHDDAVDIDIALDKSVHIYKDALQFRIVKPKEVTLHPQLPEAQMLDGDAVYNGKVHVSLPLETIAKSVQGPFTLEVTLQGCSDAGICYQPFSKRFELPGVQGGFFNRIGGALEEGNAAKIADLLSHESAFFIVLLFFIFGILLALTPCVFPMIPILSSIIVSQQKGNEKPSTAKAFFTSLVYVVAMALTYTVVGIIAGLVGADIQTAMQNPWVLTAFAGLFVALALSLFGYFELGLPASWQSKLSRVSDEAGQKGGFVGTAIMGLLSALIVGPCVAPPLAGAVIFISQTGDAVLGGLALFVMSMGMGLPLLLVGVGAGKFMPKPGGWMSVVSQSFGVMMLAMAIFMLSRVLPDGVTLLLWAILFVATGVYMGAFESGRYKGAKKLFAVAGLMFVLYGASLFVGAISGAHSMLRPFEAFKAPAATVAQKAQDKNTHRGYSIERLMKEVRASDKPVVVDFGKESCTSCKELEEITFPDPAVKKELKNFTFIRIDVTDNTDEEKALLKKFGLFGTPNIIFFDKNGTFMPEKSLTGFIKPEKFVEHLKRVRQEAQER